VDGDGQINEIESKCPGAVKISGAHEKALFSQSANFLSKKHKIARESNNNYPQ